jgi:hypothetical protein
MELGGLSNAGKLEDLRILRGRKPDSAVPAREFAKLVCAPWFT